MRPCVRFLSLFVLAASVWAADSSSAPARFAYQKPPRIVTDVLESPALPTVVVSPREDRMLVVQTRRHPSIADMAQPMLRIAGLRINPATNGTHHPSRHTGFSLVTFADGQSRTLAVPANAYLSLPEWAGDGKHFAFTNTVANGIELWVGDADSGSLRRIPGVQVNAAYRDPVQWMPDSRTLLVKTIPAGRGKPPVEERVPEGPNVQESSGKPAPIRTYEDLLQNPYDEALYEYYCTSQLALVDIAGGHLTPVGKPALVWAVSPSPDGRHLLVTYNHRPYSYLLPANDFPKEVEVWDLKGSRQYKLASLPLAEHVPIEGVLTGPRDYEWRPSQPASLAWVEALDGGDPKAQAPFRDRLMTLEAPFQSQPREVIKLEQRFQTRFGLSGSATAMAWVDGGQKALVSDYDRDRRWVRTFLVDFDHPGAEAKLIWSRSVQDRYKDPGLPVMHTLPNGFEVALQSGNAIYLRGNGSSRDGDHPFLDRYDLASNQSERLFQSGETSYESVTAVLDDSAARFVTLYESPADYPNYFLREKGSTAEKQLTDFRDPAPQLKLIKKQLVRYKRDDGVSLSFTLYLPPDCDSAGNPPQGWTACRHAGERLPSIIWAYPLEFNDAATAGQVSGSPYRFTQINGMSELWLVTQGYAILDNATMPVIGNPETMNDTYVQQVVSSAKAAIDKAAEMGVTDPNRVGVGGHSYGAFMTANLLAHSDLFRAGVARSGAYNRTLTPFGFQSERRTFWEAEGMYMKVSPFAFADKIRVPILLIHGEADDNSGTFPIQSERMYQAIKGNGGTVRYVTLPYEAHGYLGLESVEHTVWEMITWFDKWVKNPSANNVAGSK